MGQIMALAAAICGAFSSIMYNRLGSKADSDLIAYVRMIFALPMYIVLAFLTDGLPSFTSHDFWILFASGFVGFFITDMFLFKGYVIWGARETMVVMCLAPVFSAILAFYVFGESLTSLQITGIILTTAGIIMMVASDGLDIKKIFCTGFICALAASVFQSFSDIIAKFSLSTMPWVTAGAIRALGGTIGWCMLAPIRGKQFFRNMSGLTDRKTMLSFIINIIIGTVLGTAFAMAALQMAPAGIVTSLKQISPVFILIYEIFFQKKNIKAFSIAGTIVTIAGAIMLF